VVEETQNRKGRSATQGTEVSFARYATIWATGFA